MPRPVQKRTAKSYARDIEVLNRLRAAIVLDRTLNRAYARTAIEAIDRLIASLFRLVPDSDALQEAINDAQETARQRASKRESIKLQAATPVPDSDPSLN